MEKISQNFGINALTVRLVLIVSHFLMIYLFLDILFTPNQIEKGFLGFELIKISLQSIKTSENVSIFSKVIANSSLNNCKPQINAVLSPSFLRLFIQSLSVRTHPLHSASQQLVI